MAAGDRPTLVLEDDALLALDLEDTLRDGGFGPVVRALDLAEALAAIDRAPLPFAVLDFELAGETSAPAAERLRALGATVVVLTGAAGRARRALPWATVISKPATPEALFAALARGAAAPA